MKRFLLLWFLTIITLPGFAQKDQPKIEQAIAGFFNGLSLINADTLYYYSTADFHLLEDGEVWNMDTLVNKMSLRKGISFTRINSFRFIKTTVDADRAWVSYFNTADFTSGDKHQTVRWLESAVLIRNKGRWKIQLLHSTRLK